MNFPFHFQHWKVEHKILIINLLFQIAKVYLGHILFRFLNLIFGRLLLVEQTHALSKTSKPQCYMKGNISELFKSFWGFPNYLLWFLWFNLVELFEFLRVLNTFGGLRKTNFFQRIISITHSASHNPQCGLSDLEVFNLSIFLSCNPHPANGDWFCDSCYV